MRRNLRVLFTSAGRRVELIRCFQADARALELSLEVFACDLEPEWSAACRSADLAFRVPPCNTSGYFEQLLAFCHERGVDLVVPTIDTDLEGLSLRREAFRATGAMVHVSDREVVRIAHDKWRTARHLAAHGVPVPRTETPEAVLAAPAEWPWPLFVKPRHGSAGTGTRVIHSPSELAALAADPPLVVQELLQGEEYTVNLFVDAAGVLRAAVPHLRRQVRAGEVEKGVTRRHPILCDIARRLARALPGAFGSLCFQAKIDGMNQARVFEINARFGGGYPLAHRAGATFSRWLLADLAGLDPGWSDDWQDGLVMLRYDAALFYKEGTS